MKTAEMKTCSACGDETEVLVEGMCKACAACWDVWDETEAVCDDSPITVD